MKQKIAIIQYNAGNVQSVLFALERLNVSGIVTADPDLIRTADKVIFPGVGAADKAMTDLRRNGLDQLIPELRQPVLGICLGQQLMCRFSEEGDAACLGIFPQDVSLFTKEDRVPQIGWKQVSGLQTTLFNGIAEQAYFYFVHSYYAAVSAATIGIANGLDPYSAALQKDNFFGVQFHPERSGKAGSILLQNFINL